MTIIITQSGKGARKVQESNFVNENNLQSFIYENPDSVPLYEIHEDIRLLILAREVPTRSGSIDAIGTDSRGDVYIIETKLYKNSDKRLVIAQVLDYGASISQNANNQQEFFQVIEDKVNHHFKSSMHEKVAGFFNISLDESSDVVNAFKENLANGCFRFVVLMDRLEKRLKDLITFLNRNARFDVYGVELEFYKYEDFEITIPKLFGAEVKKEVANATGSGRRKTWNEESFFEDAKNHMDENKLGVLRKTYNFFVNDADRVRWGTGAVKGSFNPIYSMIASKSILTFFSDGTMQLNYSWFSENLQQLKYKEKFREIFGKVFELPPDDGSFKYPTFPISVWGSEDIDIPGIVKDLVKNHSSKEN